MQGKPSVALK